jgi:two-component sensor histidine kinase
MANHKTLQLIPTHERPGAPPPFPDVDFAMSEANHRISNNLTLLASSVSIRAAELSRHPRRLASGDISLILGEVTARISTVAWLHRFLSEQPDADKLDLNEHLYELCETLISALSDTRRVALVRSGTSACVIRTDDVLPLCLIVTEVVTNSLKYAHPTGVAGVLSIGCRRDADGSVVVEVGDDGVGLPEGFDFATADGTGSRTIRVLAMQIGAQIDYQSRPIGLLFKLRLPPRGGRLHEV